MGSINLHSPDRLNRIALVAVELIDPVTLLLVSQGIKVKAEGLIGSPIVNFSGRFAWFAEEDHWPTRFLIDPGWQPYETEVVSAPLPPANPGEPKPDENRLMRILLRPTSAYPFTDGVTVVRGQLRTTAAADAEAISGAEVWIRWLNHPSNSGEVWVDTQPKAVTNKNGEFVALLRLPNGARPYERDGNRVISTKLKVRIAVAHNSLVCEMADPQTEWKIYELPEGSPYDWPIALAWSVLTPVNNF